MAKALARTLLVVWLLACTEPARTNAPLPAPSVPPPPPTEVSPVSLDSGFASETGTVGVTGDASNPPFSYFESPSASLIPNAPVRGVANGQPFNVREILFEATRHEWRVSFCERSLSRPTDFVHGQALHLYVHDPITPGKPLVHPMKAGGGYFAIRAPSATAPEAVVSWTSEHAYYLEVTHMTTKPYDPSGPLLQEAGRASGRIYIAYRGGARFLNSGLTGTFNNAIVRYYGKPFWLE